MSNLTPTSIRLHLFYNSVIDGSGFEYAVVVLEGSRKPLYLFMRNKKRRGMWSDAADYLEPIFYKMVCERINTDAEVSVPAARFAVQAPFPIPYEEIDRRVEFNQTVQFLLKPYEYTVKTWREDVAP